jgi:hypothetical protein
VLAVFSDIWKLLRLFFANRTGCIVRILLQYNYESEKAVEDYSEIKKIREEYGIRLFYQEDRGTKECRILSKYQNMQECVMTWHRREAVTLP